METNNKKVIVKWIDARLYPGMYKKDEALERKMEIFESVGFLVENSNEVVKIAHEMTDSGEYRDILLIPSGTVISIQELTILFV